MKFEPVWLRLNRPLKLHSTHVPTHLDATRHVFPVQVPGAQLTFVCSQLVGWVGSGALGWLCTLLTTPCTIPNPLGVLSRANRTDKSFEIEPLGSCANDSKADSKAMQSTFFSVHPAFSAMDVSWRLTGSLMFSVDGTYLKTGSHPL